VVIAMVKHIRECKSCNGGWTWWNRTSCWICGISKPAGAKKLVKKETGVEKAAKEDASVPPKVEMGRTQKQTLKQQQQSKELAKLRQELVEAKKALKDKDKEPEEADSAGWSGEEVDDSDYAHASIEEIKEAVKALEESAFGKTPQMTALIEQHKEAIKKKEKERDAARPHWQLDRKLLVQVDKAKKQIAKGRERVSEIDQQVEELAKEKKGIEELEVKLDGEIKSAEAELATLSQQRAGLPSSLAATFCGIQPDLLDTPEIKRVEKMAINCFSGGHCGSQGQGIPCRAAGTEPVAESRDGHRSRSQVGERDPRARASDDGNHGGVREAVCGRFGDAGGDDAASGGIAEDA